MQLTNIARDVGEDARLGRLYLPRQWLAEEGIDADTWLARPQFTPALGRVIERMLTHADELYDRSAVGITALPVGCRPAMHAARLLYREIGHEVRRRGLDSVNGRAVVSWSRKARCSVPPRWPPRADSATCPTRNSKPLVTWSMRPPRHARARAAVGRRSRRCRGPHRLARRPLHAARAEEHDAALRNGAAQPASWASPQRARLSRAPSRTARMLAPHAKRQQGLHPARVKAFERQALVHELRRRRVGPDRHRPRIERRVLHHRDASHQVVGRTDPAVDAPQCRRQCHRGRGSAWRDLALRVELQRQFLCRAVASLRVVETRVVPSGCRARDQCHELKPASSGSSPCCCRGSRGPTSAGRVARNRARHARAVRSVASDAGPPVEGRTERVRPTAAPDRATQPRGTGTVRSSMSMTSTSSCQRSRLGPISNAVRVRRSADRSRSVIAQRRVRPYRATLMALWSMAWRGRGGARRHRRARTHCRRMRSASGHGRRRHWWRRGTTRRIRRRAVPGRIAVPVGRPLHRPSSFR